MKLFKEKKGIELSLNTIVIAILVMIVLFVVVLILTGAFADIVPKLDSFMSCDGRGGHCEPSPCEGETSIHKYHECGRDDKEEYCCFPKG